MLTEARDQVIQSMKVLKQEHARSAESSSTEAQQQIGQLQAELEEVRVYTRSAHV